MEKTSCKICYILRHGFIALFAFAISMALGISGFTQLIKIYSDELSAEVTRLDMSLLGTKASVLSEGSALDPPFYMCYLFIAFAAALLVFTLLYIRKICKIKIKNS